MWIPKLGSLVLEMVTLGHRLTFSHLQNVAFKFTVFFGSKTQEEER